MATIHPIRLSGQARRPLAVEFLDKYFYFLMSLLIAAIVIYGFSHTIGDNLLHPAEPRPGLLYLHAVCFSAWVAFFFFQSLLVRTRNVRVHRLTGWFGVALGALMVVLGYIIAVVMARFNLHILHQADAVPFLIVPLFDITNFAIFLTLAVLWRRKPELHRRLILLATCDITAAGFGRFPFHFPPPLLFYYGVDALMLLGVVRDVIVNRRIHKVYLYTLPALAACQWVVVYVFLHQPALWMKISRALLG
jgi:hypothetical protein